MSLNNSLKKMKYDLRLLEWNLANKKITQEDYKKHLEALEDISANADTIPFEKLVKRSGGSKATTKH